MHSLTEPIFVKKTYATKLNTRVCVIKLNLVHLQKKET